MCRLSTAVKINACTRRLLPGLRVSSSPSWAKSSWHSTPGSPSATRTVVVRTPNPHRSTANRCSVRYGTRTPRRASSSSIFTIDNGSCFARRPRRRSPRPGSAPRARAAPPTTRRARSAGPAGPPPPPTPTSSSVTASTPASRASPAACAASTYRRAVLRSTPARSATFRSPCPSSHARSTSRTSTTLTSLNPTRSTSTSVDMTRAVNERTEDLPAQARRVVP